MEEDAALVRHATLEEKSGDCGDKRSSEGGHERPHDVFFPDIIPAGANDHSSTVSTTSATSPPPPLQQHINHDQLSPTPPSERSALLATLNARREQIKDILNGKTSELHSLHSDLKAKSLKNREERVQLARQMNEIHASHAARDQRRLEVERELSRIQKQNLVNDIMYRKQVQADYRAHLETIESNEVLLLHKLEAIDEERARRQAAKIASVQDIQDRFAPVLDLLQVEENDAKQRIEHIAAQGTDNMDVALARELQKNISSTYQDKLEKSTEARQHLTAQRFEVEAEVRTRTEMLRGLPQCEGQARDSNGVPFVYGQNSDEARRFEARMSVRLPSHLSKDEEETGGVPVSKVSILLEKARSTLTGPFSPTKATANAAATTTDRNRPYKNYSFKNTLERAKAMDSTVQQRVDLHQIRLEELQTELNWVNEGPQTEQWKKVSTRAIRTPQISKSKALLEHFVATQDSRAQHRELEEDDWAWEEGATFVFLTVLEEACQEAAEQVAKELLSVRVGAQRMVETLLVQSVSGLQEKERHNLQISGKAHLLRGCARGVKATVSRHRAASARSVQPLLHQQQSKRRYKQAQDLFRGMFSADSDLVEETCPRRTQRLVYGYQISAQSSSSSSGDVPPPPPFYNEAYSGYQLPRAAPPLPDLLPGQATDPHLVNFPSVDRKISLWKSMLEFNNQTDKEALLANEYSHFQGLTLPDHPSARIQLPVPAELQGLCLLRCFARANKCLSLLVMGAKNGRFAVYSVPWQSSSTEEAQQRRGAAAEHLILNDSSAPTLVCLSPKIPSIEVSPIVDLQETVLPSSQLISLDERGVIRVWCLNPVSKRKAHSSSLFTRFYTHFKPIYASCTFYITPTEFNLPMPTPFSFFQQRRGGFNKAASEGSTSAPQEGTFPQKILLLPSSTTLSGRTPSLLAGTSGGDVFKVNLDFKEKYFASRFIHPAPFVDVEFMHSASMTTGTGNRGNVHMIMAAADKRKTAKGRNPVYREIFHYHTAPIVLLECLGKVNSNIISIDAEGKVALWAYSSDLFEPMGWFRPLRTAELDLRYLTLTRLKVSPAHPLPPQTPPSNILELLQPMRRQRREGRGGGEELVETFQPVRGVPDHPHRLEVQYERHTPVTPFSASHSRSSPGSGTGTGPGLDHAVPAAEPTWSAYNVTTSLLSAGVLDVQLTRDGEEVVLLMTYEGLRDDGSGNENLALSELQRTERARQKQARAAARSRKYMNTTKKSPRSKISSQNSSISISDKNSSTRGLLITPVREQDGDDENNAMHNAEVNDDDSLVSLDQASLSLLDMVTDSEGEEDEEREGARQLGLSSSVDDVVDTVHRTAEQFGFWMRDREQQMSSLSSLDLEEIRRELREAVGAPRRVSTVEENEHRNHYGPPVNPTWNDEYSATGASEGNESFSREKGASTSVREMTMFAVVACLNLDTWTFHAPLVEFSLQSTELVMGMHVGPVQRQTLTRGVFVQTTSQLRVFSLETGVEFISESLPLATPSLLNAKKPFRPLMGTLCPLQSMVAFGCADLSMVVVNKIDVLVPQRSTAHSPSKRGRASGGEGFTTEEKGQGEHEEQQAVPLSALAGLRRQVSRLRRVVHDLFVPLPLQSPPPPPTPLPEPWLMETISTVLDDALAGVWLVQQQHKRGGHAAAVLGTGAHLGVIAPTQWPDADMQRMERGALSGMDMVLAVRKGADKWLNFGKKQQSQESGSVRSRSSSNISSSEGESSEYESDASSVSTSSSGSRRGARSRSMSFSRSSTSSVADRIEDEENEADKDETEDKAGDVVIKGTDEETRLSDEESIQEDVRADAWGSRALASFVDANTKAHNDQQSRRVAMVKEVKEKDQEEVEEVAKRDTGETVSDRYGGPRTGGNAGGTSGTTSGEEEDILKDGGSSNSHHSVDTKTYSDPGTEGKDGGDTLDQEASIRDEEEIAETHQLKDGDGGDGNGGHEDETGDVGAMEKLLHKSNTNDNTNAFVISSEDEVSNTGTEENHKEEEQNMGNEGAGKNKVKKATRKWGWGRKK